MAEISLQTDVLRTCQKATRMTQTGRGVCIATLASTVSKTEFGLAIQTGEEPVLFPELLL